MISQLITVAYNMADTFFIGQVGDPNQVAAVSLCMPLFVLLTGMANLFGIGGSSLISRSLGEGDTERAKRVSAFNIWTAETISLCYGLLVFALRGYILPAVGANAETYRFCSQYIFWATTIGAAPTVLNAAFAIATGMSQGVLPLIGYNYSAKNFKRMMSAVKTTFVYRLAIALFFPA